MHPVLRIEAAMIIHMRIGLFITHPPGKFENGMFFITEKAQVLTNNSFT